MLVPDTVIEVVVHPNVCRIVCGCQITRGIQHRIRQIGISGKENSAVKYRRDRAFPQDVQGAVSGGRIIACICVIYGWVILL